MTENTEIENAVEETVETPAEEPVSEVAVEETIADEPVSEEDSAGNESEPATTTDNDDDLEPSPSTLDIDEIDESVVSAEESEDEIDSGIAMEFDATGEPSPLFYRPIKKKGWEQLLLQTLNELGKDVHDIVDIVGSLKAGLNSERLPVVYLKGYVLVAFPEYSTFNGFQHPKFKVIPVD